MEYDSNMLECIMQGCEAFLVASQDAKMNFANNNVLIDDCVNYITSKSYNDVLEAVKTLISAYPTGKTSILLSIYISAILYIPELDDNNIYPQLSKYKNIDGSNLGDDETASAISTYRNIIAPNIIRKYIINIFGEDDIFTLYNKESTDGI